VQRVDVLLGVIVLDAIMSPLPVEAAQGPTPLSPNMPGPDEASPVVGPIRAVEALVSLLNRSNPRCPPEVKANVCMLFGQLGRKGSRTTREREAEVEKLKVSARDVLVKCSQGDDLFGKAVKKVLEVWETA